MSKIAQMLSARRAGLMQTGMGLTGEADRIYGNQAGTYHNWADEQYARDQAANNAYGNEAAAGLFGLMTPGGGPSSFFSNLFARRPSPSGSSGGTGGEPLGGGGWTTSGDALTGIVH